MRTCRLCLYKGNEKQVTSVFDNEFKDLARKIRDCVSISIKEDDELPTSACLSCIHQVKQWVSFRETCLNSDKILHSSIAADDKLSDVEIKREGCKTVKAENLWYSACNDDEDGDSDVPLKTLRLRNAASKGCKSSFESDSSDDDDKNVEHAFDEDLCDLKRYKANLLLNTYQCDVCSSEFDDCLEYLDHQEVHNGEAVFNCDKCSEVFKFRADLVEHDKNHRNPCPQCGKLILKSSMKLHLIKHTDKYMCKQCSGRFNSKATLAQHIITVHTDIKDHICETCGKRFSSQTSMKVHMRSHSDERLYPCKLCSYAGRTASAIYVHMSTHANDLCVCEVCSKTFKSNRNLNDHLRRVHSKEKKHECTYCDKKFVDKYMLRVHVRCHTGVRPYQCVLCEKAFIRSDGLKEHMATHGQNRTLYDCKDCGKKFTSKRGITRHTCTLHL